jgi:hypothetical protein
MQYPHCSCACHEPSHEHLAPAAPCGCGARCGGACQQCGGTRSSPRCPPPPMPCHEGTVNLPPHAPPPSVGAGPGTEPPGSDGRPGKGQPGEGPWFSGRVKQIEKGPPSFGPRKNEYLPYLLLRSNPGDRGGRAVPGVFWESPDIFVHSGVPADSAPLKPPDTGGVATVGAPTTLYAHVWNLGRAPVWGAYVEFSWFNPSLGFSYASANRLGAAMVDLGDRFTSFPDWREATGPAGDRYLTRGCHAIVRCPVTWVPTWENGGHECLVVRVFEPFMDPVDLTSYDARTDRHVGQRNIAVVQAHSPAEVDLTLDIGAVAAPARADVEVTVDQPASMPWLQMYVGAGKPLPRTSGSTVVAGVLPPTLAGARRVTLTGLPLEQRRPFLTDHERFQLGCDPARIGLHAAADLAPGEAHVVRVSQRQEGVLVGGYTVVLVKSV